MKERLLVQQGFFLCPKSITNHQSTKPKKLLGQSIGQIYQASFPDAYAALEFFLRINGQRINPLDNDEIATNFAVLGYLLAMHQHRMKAISTDLASYNKGKLNHLFTTSHVKAMYRDLKEHLAQKGLSEDTIREVVYDPVHGQNNIMGMFNAWSRQYYQSDEEKEKINKVLLTQIQEFRKRNPFAHQMGTVLENMVLHHTEQVLHDIGLPGKLLAIDAGATKIKLKGKKPDFFFMSEAFCCAVDTKVDLQFAKPQQVSPEVGQKVFAALAMK